MRDEYSNYGLDDAIIRTFMMPAVEPFSKTNMKNNQNTMEVREEKGEIPDNAISILNNEIELYIPFEDLVDIKEEIERLEKEKARLESEVLRGEKMLSNPGFVNKAPEAKINEEKAKLENYKQMLVTVVERLNSMR